MGDTLVLQVGVLVGTAVDKSRLGQAGCETGAFIVAELGARDGDRLNVVLGGTVGDEDKGGSLYLYGGANGAMLGAACLYEGLRHDGETLPRGTG